MTAGEERVHAKDTTQYEGDYLGLRTKRRSCLPTFKSSALDFRRGLIEPVIPPSTVGASSKSNWKAGKALAIRLQGET